jgi:hypothetical protein
MTEIVVFLLVSFGVLLLIARRNGAFAARRHGEPDGSEAYSPVTPRTSIQIRDPRAQWRR